MPGALRAESGRAGRQRTDGVRIALEIAVGVGLGAGRLAEHVVGKAIAAFLQIPGAVQGVFDGLAEHELPAEYAHGPAHRLADHGLAEPAQQPVHDVRRLLPGRHQPPGHHQSEGGGVDEEGLGRTQVPLPVAGAELLLDELVLGVGIGDAQQRLGEAHEGDALLR